MKSAPPQRELPSLSHPRQTPPHPHHPPQEFNHSLDDALSKRKASQESVRAQIEKLERALAMQRARRLFPHFLPPASPAAAAYARPAAAH